MTDNKTYQLDARVAMPSLWDPEVAGAALEAFVDEDDRMSGGLAFLFCDDEGKLLQPVMVSDIPAPLTIDDRWTALRWATGLCEMVGDDHAGPLGLIMALVREHGPICDADRTWHQVALDACAEAEVPMLGMHLVTMDGVVTLPAALRAA